MQAQWCQCANSSKNDRWLALHVWPSSLAQSHGCSYWYIRPFARSRVKIFRTRPHWHRENSIEGFPVLVASVANASAIRWNLPTIPCRIMLSNGTNGHWSVQKLTSRRPSFHTSAIIVSKIFWSVPNLPIRWVWRLHFKRSNPHSSWNSVASRSSFWYDPG